MASKRKNLHDNLELHFILLPFKTIYVYSLLSLMIAVVALTVTYFYCSSIELSGILNQYFSVTFEHSNWHQIIAAKTYQSIDWLIFDLTKIRSFAGGVYPADSINFKIQLYLLQHAEGINHFSTALKILAYRIGIVATYILFLAPILLFVAMLDGLSQRAIRRDNIGRESAGIYHRVKYWNRGTTILLIQMFVAAPFFIAPQWFMIPILVWAYFVKTTFKYYKKYL